VKDLTQPLTREVPLKCYIIVYEFQHGVRVRSEGISVLNKRPSDIRVGLTKIFGDDVKKRRMRGR